METQQEPCQEVQDLRNAQTMLREAYAAYDALDWFETDALAAALEMVHNAESALAAAQSALNGVIRQAIADADTIEPMYNETSETLGQIATSFP
jgi:hypothetical protein